MLTERIRQVLTDIRRTTSDVGRAPESVRLVAVSKTFAASLIREAHAAGLSDFAENYVQEALVKQEELQGLQLTWHFIGRIQSNKIKHLAGKFHLIHSVESFSMAESLSRHSQGIESILLQVNLVGESSKAGADWRESLSLLGKVKSLPNICVRGLMFMAPLTADMKAQEKFYIAAENLFHELKLKSQMPETFKELSMGSSHDFKAAIRHGATMIRLGTALFGQRS